MNVSLCCHLLCICYSKYNLVSRVSSKCNHTALLKDCVSICIICMLPEGLSLNGPAWLLQGKMDGLSI